MFESAIKMVAERFVFISATLQINKKGNLQYILHIFKKIRICHS